MFEIKIIRKEGFKLNPNDEIVNRIFRELDKNGGHCPTIIKNRVGHDQCPCSEYLQNNICYCKLYIKEDKDKVR